MVTNEIRTAKLFRFLKRNSAWNEAFQSDEYRRGLWHCQSPGERLTQLLHSTVYSQTKPKLTLLSEFWRQLHALESERTNSLSEFTEHLRGRHNPTTDGVGPWDRLFHALKAQPGWGDKTAALFVKAVIRIHRGPKVLHFWLNADRLAKAPLTADRVYLPVDSVIVQVFREIGFESPNFWSINNFLLATYSPEEMLVWDDLWYWGFFTQYVQDQGRTRISAWNSDKFWSQLGSPKGDEATVKRLGERFIKIIS
jgi:hypothetical protein